MNLAFYHRKHVIDGKMPKIRGARKKEYMILFARNNPDGSLDVIGHWAQRKRNLVDPYDRNIRTSVADYIIAMR